MGAERKKAIYDICVEFGKDVLHFIELTRVYTRFLDVIIVEDDPYYFLQQGVYQPKSGRSTASLKRETDKFLSSLAPSYLKFDYQGRVIRLDTFSKVTTINIDPIYLPRLT